MQILVVEDDAAVRAIIVRGLAEDGLDVEAFGTGRDGLEAARSRPYDLLILDINLPDTTGLEMAEALRGEGNDAPILFLTGRDSEDEIVEGLDVGADGYMTKPFSLIELRARIRAIHRRRSMAIDRRLIFRDLEMDPVSREVTRGGVRLHLTEVEFKLLAAILSGEGEARSREDLLREVWRIDFDPGTGLLDVHLSNLRKKLNQAGPPILKTVREKGYGLIKEGE